MEKGGMYRLKTESEQKFISDVFLQCVIANLMNKIAEVCSAL